jgi:elongation factor Tu
MPVENVFFIHGRGVVVTGLIADGMVTVGDRIELVRTNGTHRIVEVKGVETFRKVLTSASAGDNVGILLAGLQKEDISHGDILHKSKKE